MTADEVLVLMRVDDAKALARQWVSEEASRTPGFQGAVYHGSTVSLPDEATLPPTSDIDVLVVLDRPDAANKLGKFLYHGIVLDVFSMASDQLPSAEAVLGQYHLAGSFRGASVISDPTGKLTGLQETVTENFAKRDWVVRRCEHARDRLLNGYRLNATDAFPDQVTTWLFPAGITTHIVLVAGLQNPTVRRRYMAARDLLTEYGKLELYETLLALLGCAEMTMSRAEQHLAALTAVFDATTGVIRTAFPFAADISALGRPIAIDGSRALIESGYHREAIFWMVATYSRCQKMLLPDAPPALREQFEPGYRDLLSDLGIGSFADLEARAERVRGAVPRVWDAAMAIVDANGEIEDEGDIQVT